MTLKHISLSRNACRKLRLERKVKLGEINHCFVSRRIIHQLKGNGEVCLSVGWFEVGGGIQSYIVVCTQGEKEMPNETMI